REFLGNTSTQIVTLEAHGTWTHPASFTSYEEARRARIAGLEEDHRRYQEQRSALIATLKEYRRRAQQSDAWGPKVRAAQSRLRLFDEKTELVERPREQQVTIRLGGGRTGTIALRVKQLTFPGLTKPFSTEVLFGQRVSVMGKNGTGKSHFVRLLAGHPVDHTGDWMLGARVNVGYFSQLPDSPHLARPPPPPPPTGRAPRPSPSSRARGSTAPPPWGPYAATSSTAPPTSPSRNCRAVS